VKSLKGRDDNMKQVIIEIGKDGRPFVAYAPKKIEVLFREPKKHGFRKQLRTLAYKTKSFLGMI
jgi:hypothetical protein